MIEVKSIALHSSERALPPSLPFATCGTYSRLNQEFPGEWHRRLLANVETNLRLAS